MICQIKFQVIYIIMSADDTKPYHTIISESQCNILQQNLNNVMDWGNNYAAD